jgi:hypothetical protein
MEKYGFVYIWYDRKYKRYYIGSHWGTEDDGYICSSTWMKTSYLRRPNDFKRRIIKRVYESRSTLLDEEYKYLSMIKDEELKKKYYNLNKRQIQHWWSKDYSRLTTAQKISKSKTGKQCSKRGPRTQKDKHSISIGTSIGMKKYFELNGVRCGEKNNQYGTFWITNGIDSKKLKAGELIPDGWRKGRVIKFKLEK